MSEKPLRTSRSELTTEQRRIEAWPSAEPFQLSQPKQELFERRRQAICAYMRNEPLAEIRGQWKFSRWEIRRLRKRCLKVHPDGRLWGFRALLPGTPIKFYLRLAEPKPRRESRRGGYGGLLGRVFNRFPEVRTKVYTHFLRQRPGANEAWIPIASSHKKFVEACREAGIAETEYPFTTKYLGIRALATHLDSLYTSDMQAAVRASYGVEAARGLKTGKGDPKATAVTLPLQRVQFDGHRIDAIFVLKIPHPKGGFYEKVVTRPWLLVIQDVVTRAILGWHLCTDQEYDEHDILKCVRNAAEPWQRRTLTIPGLTYHPTGGMPSDVIEKMKWAMWAELCYDNAKANLSDWVRRQIAVLLNCAVNPGAVAFPERRAIVEALFRALEEKHFHRLPNTTGSNPQDPRRDDAEKAAKEFHISISHLEELLHAIMCNYGGDHHPALSYRTPLEQLRFLLDEEDVLVRHLRLDEQARVNLLAMHITRKVCGSIKRGRRPYIQYLDERYTNDVLSRSPDLIGAELTLVVDTRDLRTVAAFLPDGAELGVLMAMGKWSATPHTLTTRQIANSKRVLKVQHHANPANVDPVHALLHHLSEEALKSKRAASQYDATRKEAGLPEDYHPAEADAKAAELQLPATPVAKLRSKKRSIVY